MTSTAILHKYKTSCFKRSSTFDGEFRTRKVSETRGTGHMVGYVYDWAQIRVLPCRELFELPGLDAADVNSSLY
jgi:hypothetical protein